MADSNFSAELNEKLHRYYQDLERNLLPSLKTDCRTFQNIFEALVKILLKKGIIIQDPYRYEEKIIEISPMPSEPFPDSERLTEMSVRIANFQRKLEYLNNYFQFSVDFLDFARLKNLAGFFRFINWENLSFNHPDSAQRAMAYFVSRAQTPDDPLSSGLVRDAVNQLEVLQKRILEAIKRITFYKREEYKSLLRNTIGEALQQAAKMFTTNAEEAGKYIRKEFATHIRGQVFIPELVREILLEEDPVQGSALKRELLAKLTVKEEKKSSIPRQQDLRPMLLEALRQMSNIGPVLESALKKLKNNAEVLEDKKLSWGEQLSSWIRSLLGGKRESPVYEVEIYDAQSAVVKPEQIEFDKFCEQIDQEIKTLANLASGKNSAFYVKLAAKPENEIVDFINTHFVDLSRITERINALDVYFKTEVPKARRNAIRGTKLEVMQIRSLLTAVNKTKLEYLSAVEEIEQLKKLGIKLDG